MAGDTESRLRQLSQDLAALELFPRTVTALEELDAALGQLEVTLGQEERGTAGAHLAAAREAGKALRRILADEEPRLRRLEQSLQACRASMEACEYPDLDPDA